MRKIMHAGVVYALFAAVLFGASTPFAKMLVGQVPPVTLAGLLYLGSGIGLLACYGVRALVKRRAQDQPVRLARADLPWLAGAVAAGGVAGPLLLMIGLSSVSASSASLLLNMEGVLTSLLAWCVFKENVDRRIFSGMLLIVAAGVLLSWDQAPVAGLPWGAMAIVGACLCWGIDNNLTRQVSASDPRQIAATKGLVAGAVNLAIGWTIGASMPAVQTVLLAGVVGFCGYGVSLVLFVLALRHLGTARAGAYFSAAPFAGAALSMLVFGDIPGLLFWVAATLMGAGIWLHLTESHGHEHTHEPITHGHAHTHDEHHQHAHDAPWDGIEPHVHSHRHVTLTHRHAHYPDIHHRHEH
jgi:drug/metabolite transporter (DMT)-like permease